MLFPNVKIKRLVSVGFVLGGAVAGCNEDEPAPNDGDLVTVPSDQDMMTAVCSVHQQCAPDEFSDEFASFEECVADGVSYASALEEEMGQACADAWRTYYNCYAVASEDMCLDDDALEQACVDEATEFYSVCEIWE